MEIAVSQRECARARRALSLLLDGEVVAGDVRVLARHLGSCAACEAYARSVSAVTRELRAARWEVPRREELRTQ